MTIVNYDWDEDEDNIVEEYDDTGATVAEYTTESKLFGNLLSQRRGDHDSFYHYDGIGSTLALTDSNGNVTDTYAYSAFGEVTAQTVSTANPFQYIGKKGYYWDDDIGEYEVRRRPLSIRWGRWLAFESLSRFILQQYKYCNQQPLTYIDADGCDLAALPDKPTPYSKDEWVSMRPDGKHTIGNDWLWSLGLGDPPLVVQRVTVNGYLECTIGYAAGCPLQKVRYTYSWFEIWNEDFVDKGKDEKRKDKHKSGVGAIWIYLNSKCPYNCDPRFAWGWIQTAKFQVTNVAVTPALAALGTSWFHRTEPKAIAKVECVNPGICPCMTQPAIKFDDFHRMVPIVGDLFGPDTVLAPLFAAGSTFLSCEDEWRAGNLVYGSVANKLGYWSTYSTTGYH